MPPTTNLHKIIHFGNFTVTPQVFHTTPYSFCLVNLKPLLPGHILVSPLRKVPFIADLTPAELSDLFSTVQKVEKTLKRLYNAQAFNIAIQDGTAAGQSVPHVHAHVIPRKFGDMDQQGGGDKLYELLEGEEGDVGEHLKEFQGKEGKKVYNRFPKQDDASREPRDMETMKNEAEWLAREMEKDEEDERNKGDTTTTTTSTL